MTKAKTLLFIFCCALILSQRAYTQQPAYTYYTIREGLASNDIYNCAVDKKGFLWLATENGVSKFDGRNFINYTVAQGLPDNEILTVEIDSAGVVWVLPFQKSPAYYDEKKDRFINSSIDQELGKISFASVNYCNALSGGGMGFCNSAGQIFIYKNKKCTVYTFKGNDKPYHFSRIIELDKDSYLLITTTGILLLKHGTILNKIWETKQWVKNSVFANNNLYFSDTSGLVKVKVEPDGSIGNFIKSRLPFKISAFNFTGKQIAISSPTGNIYFADTATLAFGEQSFSFNSFPRNVLEDKMGNTWICTKENGLIRYQQKGILSISNTNFQRNFNSISFFKNNIITGTNDGELFLYRGPYAQNIIKLKSAKSFTSWITKIVPINAGILIGSEGGFYFLKNDMAKTELFAKPYTNIANKDFVVASDSILFAGNSNYVTRVNYIKQKVLDTARIRVTALQNSSDSTVYIGSNTGLYIWENFKSKRKLGINYALLNTRITALTYNKIDKILWVGMATDTLVGLQGDKIVAMIPFANKLAGNVCRAIYSNQKGLLWVGTNAALARINYNQKSTQINYFISSFTTADGIAGKQINDIVERNDTIYVATTNGISIIPSKLNIAVPDIPVFITNVKINNKDSTIQNEYILKSTSNNISILFSAPDLGSTTERLYQYRINNGNWITGVSEKLELFQQSPGTYKIQIRAIKRDGNPSSKIEVIIIKIKTPLLSSFWFWFFVTLSAIALVFYFTQRNNKQKREQAVQKLLTEKKLSELELRALKAQINPHFVFNCLNSIKFLNHQKRFTETDLYLDKFSYLLRKTLDFSGLQKISLEEELAYSRNYLELEKLRLGEKLRYEIKTVESIDSTTTLVPPMLMQPYLENAIKHGIRHLPGEEGSVKIETTYEGDKIICTITDNGVGIANANNINRKDNSKPSSHGTTLQQRRADLYNVEVSTTHGENGVGTIVKLVL